jgi:hypothetical protein
LRQVLEATVVSRAANLQLSVGLYKASRRARVQRGRRRPEKANRGGQAALAPQERRRQNQVQ